MASISPSCNCDCQSDYVHVLSTIDSIEEKVDGINDDQVAGTSDQIYPPLRDGCKSHELGGLGVTRCNNKVDHIYYHSDWF